MLVVLIPKTMSKIIFRHLNSHYIMRQVEWTKQKCVNMTCFGITLNISFKTKTNKFGVGNICNDFFIFFEEVFYAHEGCFYLIKIQKYNTKNIVKNDYNLKPLLYTGSLQCHMILQKSF